MPSPSLDQNKMKKYPLRIIRFNLNIYKKSLL